MIRASVINIYEAMRLALEPHRLDIFAGSGFIYISGKFPGWAPGGFVRDTHTHTRDIQDIEGAVVIGGGGSRSLVG